MGRVFEAHQERSCISTFAVGLEDSAHPTIRANFMIDGRMMLMVGLGFTFMWMMAAPRSILAREINVLYLQYLEKQVDPALLKKIVAKSNAVEKAFNIYRAKVDGKEMTDSEVRKVLKESKNSERLQAVWEASKAIGSAVEADLKELVQLRNEAAHKLGFKNFHALQLYLNEQNTDDLMKLFDDLDELTRGPFQAAKEEIDGKIAAACHIQADQLRPWHYQDRFFQETPGGLATDIAAPYRT